MARILESCARTTDVVARYGGEEFVVLALDTDEAGLNALAERIRRSIEAATTLHHQVPSLALSALAAPSLFPTETHGLRRTTARKCGRRDV